MSYIDTRDLSDKRDSLKEQILEDFNIRFKTELTDFDDIESYLEDEAPEDKRNDFEIYWKDEYKEIKDIDEVENEVGSEFVYGCTLIEEDDFEDYVKELLVDCGYIPQDLPSWIEIDWEITSNNVRKDYSELEYQGETYYFRS